MNMVTNHMQHFFAFVIIFFYSFSINAATIINDFEITGKVVGESNELIEVGNVLILSPANSSLIRGDIFMDGTFFISNITSNNILLKITVLGYEDYLQLIENKTKSHQINIGTVVLKTKMMKGVEVVARQKLIEKRGENVVVNIANTSLSSAGTAMDVLRNSPKVFINSGGQISIIGKGNALVYVDGQLIASGQILQSLSSNDLKEIEIIENPSAKYDAAGNAVINIVTKNRNIEGFKISLTQDFEKRKFFRSYSKFNIYQKTSRFMFQASYGIKPFTRGGREHYFRTYERGNNSVEIDNKLQYAQKILAHDYSFRTTYQLSGKSKLGFQYSGTYSSADKDAENKNIYSENGSTAFKLNTKTVGPYDQQSNTLNLFFEKNLDTLGSSIFMTGQYSNYDLNRLENIYQTLHENGSLSTLNKKTYNINNIDVVTFQLDYNKKFASGMQFSSGVKNAYVTNKSILDFETELPDGSLVANPLFSNGYDYNENILATYGQLKWEKNGIKTNIGLRGEWTRTDGVAGDGSEGKLFEKNYFNLFPSVSITKYFSENISTTLSYNYRIQRPSFQDLNPFIFYVDSLVSLKGNAELIPEYSHSINAALTVKSLTFDFNYTRVNDKINTIIEIADLDSPDVFAFVRDNIENTNQFSASLTFPINKKWYSSYNVIGGRMESHNFLDRGIVVTNSKSGYYLYTNQSFQLPKNIKLEMIYQYTSPRVDGIYTDNPISALSVAVSRKFFNKHLSVRLLGNDIFDKYKFTGISIVSDTHMDYLSEGDWHFVKLSLHWDFGKLGINNFNEKKISKEELRRITRQ